MGCCGRDAICLISCQEQVKQSADNMPDAHKGVDGLKPKRNTNVTCLGHELELDNTISEYDNEWKCKLGACTRSHAVPANDCLEMIIHESWISTRSETELCKVLV